MLKRRIASLALAAVMTVSLGVTAFAAEGSSNFDDLSTTKSASFDVTATTTKTMGTTTVYYVTVDWTMTPYNDGKTTTYTWDASSLKYVAGEPTEGTARDAAVEIEITNKSNDSVKWGVEFASAKKTVDDVETAIAKETATTAPATSGTLTSAAVYTVKNEETNEDETKAIDETNYETATGTAQSVTYKNGVTYNDGFSMEDGTTMGSYTVSLAKPTTT